MILCPFYLSVFVFSGMQLKYVCNVHSYTIVCDI